MVEYKKAMAMSSIQARSDRPVSRRSLRAQACREQLMSAARDAFRVKGYAATTIDDIIARVGGSRGTIYFHFRNKFGLFEAVVREEAAQFTDAVSDISSPRKPDIVNLRDAIDQLVKVVTERDAIDLLRMIIAEGHKYPLIADLYRDLSSALRVQVRSLLRKYASHTPCALTDVDFCAELFLACVVADAQIALLAGLEDGQDKEALAERIERWLLCCSDIRQEFTSPERQPTSLSSHEGSQ
ncbi:TetR/AcrR family transcriptional regulator [Novosphingobium sp.]|uniref:TetR/AcrR family transcriptional regulator n=1 Tax=Novosphingobium sp. TaxID=1874826 RepID=UPI002FDFA436